MTRLFTPAAILVLGAGSALADGNHAVHQKGAILSETDTQKVASFDILAAHAHRAGNTVTFHMTTNGDAGADTPEPVGTVGGAGVFSYVWPTSLDPEAVGFEPGTGILALAATSHPDFDDTPLVDENNDGDTGNDGLLWHSHWVVLTPTEACGPGALAVRDIPADATPQLPATWPGLPIYLDSPGFTPLFDGPEIAVTVGFRSDVDLSGVAYDGVTSALRVNANVHAPLLCVVDVFDVASGDLSLPAKIE
ncbi:hypothetical protein [Phaeobacter gallaeciensis]|uniref:Uncharacterized protein n=1 Tax=Phaeobacter gallaeciensis TaxID=60890 RepID=A0AAC9ZBR7_9RHOB|nr:hypothetical protein [Phaeobacter gallaeciensis]AHD11578.1 hypothetical protein Gal_03870 [Phaeobacter gallaeciensis DSM 26640]ATE94842.1 hypothetical protein PhaeoP11_03856 [Phaeobacter gallaeciensis]ATE99113.1 hypothetical protein PhaeoP73_03852 [Phaeobacter gallaeciensis]ATF03506.1 hypothetical protein PhaeoP75_03905 [Phaeobacter gallaeciensis]ATF07886.1 hypothetical protein PhaeoP63_03854 [Phaeobacter gallaeciensis]